METTNPFHGGKVVSANTDAEVYRMSAGKRGELDYMMSRSELLECAWCPSRWIQGYKSPDTKPKEFGTLMDALVLGTQFADKFAVCPATYPSESKKGETAEKPWNRNSTYCKEWEAEQEKAGRTTVKADDYQEAKAAATSLLNQRDIAAIIADSDHQVMAVSEYHDEETGIVVPVKILVDIAPRLGPPGHESLLGKSLIDFKTAMSAGPGPWTRAVFEHNYHVQGAFYLDAWNAATGDDRQDFRHIIQESYAPWEVGRRLLSQEFLELGRIKYLHALKVYAGCLADNNWPGYDRGTNFIMQGFTIVGPEIWMMK